jgi:prepilin-type N-terminal cleavage/methylation domain-containing protein
MKKGFTLIELLVVITIIAILAGAALPYVQNYVDESRQAKAKSDLDEIARALVVYESREGEYIKPDVSDLTGRYLDRSPIDPWGVPYVVATESGIVYSLGPDRKDYDPGDPTTEQYSYDNIEVSYLPPLALVSVKWVDKNKSGAVDTQNVADEIHLTFSRKLADSAKTPGASLSQDVANLFDALLIANDPDNPDSFKTFDATGIATTTAASIRIVGNDKIIVIPLSNTYDDGVHAVGTNQFIAGRDKIAIAVDHGTIVDRATPQNYCISSQAVKILPQ